mmetsp:Transcript_11999/g.30261  ORF Transcript_11999/g.30261 Transcript_11999/m.30261 type:complete len:214 (+) Transcript_11999:926-1567(+)
MSPRLSPVAYKYCTKKCLLITRTSLPPARPATGSTRGVISCPIPVVVSASTPASPRSVTATPATRTARTTTATAACTAAAAAATTTPCTAPAVTATTTTAAPTATAHPALGCGVRVGGARRRARARRAAFRGTAGLAGCLEVLGVARGVCAFRAVAGNQLGVKGILDLEQYECIQRSVLELGARKGTLVPVGALLPFDEVGALRKCTEPLEAD